MKDSGIKNSEKSPDMDKINFASFDHNSFSLLTLYNVHLFDGPPCNKISFICIYKTVYTDAHTIMLWQALESTGWEGKDKRKHLITKAQEGLVMKTKVEKDAA